MFNMLFDETLIEFDLDTLEPIIPSPPGSVAPSPSDSFEESDYSDQSGIDYYEIDTDSDDEDLPTYPITNLGVTLFENDLRELVPYDQDDIVSDWNHEMIDSGPQSGPFLGHAQTNINDPDGNPEVFFKGLFDERMWTILCEATNTYTRSKCQMTEIK